MIDLVKQVTEKYFAKEIDIAEKHLEGGAEGRKAGKLKSRKVEK